VLSRPTGPRRAITRPRPRAVACSLRSRFGDDKGRLGLEENTSGRCRFLCRWMWCCSGECMPWVSTEKKAQRGVAQQSRKPPSFRHLQQVRGWLLGRRARPRSGPGMSRRATRRVIMLVVEVKVGAPSRSLVGPAGDPPAPADCGTGPGRKKACGAWAGHTATRFGRRPRNVAASKARLGGSGIFWGTRGRAVARGPRGGWGAVPEPPAEEGGGWVLGVGGCRGNPAAPRRNGNWPSRQTSRRGLPRRMLHHPCGGPRLPPKLPKHSTGAGRPTGRRKVGPRGGR